MSQANKIWENKPYLNIQNHFLQTQSHTDRRSFHYCWYKLHSRHKNHLDTHQCPDMCHHLQCSQSGRYTYSCLVCPNTLRFHHTHFQLNTRQYLEILKVEIMDENFQPMYIYTCAKGSISGITTVAHTQKATLRINTCSISITRRDDHFTFVDI